MSFRWLASLVAAVIASLAFAASATAATIGEVATVEPKSASCESFTVPVFLVQTATAGNPYTVPSGGGVITSWSTSFGVAGSEVSLQVLRPTGSKTFTIVGTDTEVLPTPIPSNHVSTFNIPAPIVARAGDLIGILVPAKTKATCIFETAGGKSDEVEFGEGHTSGTESAVSPGENLRVNVSAELNQSADLGLAQSVTPSPAAAAGVALIQLTATNAGLGALPGTLTDAVPSALPVLAAGVAGAGNCTVGGQAVSCELAAVSAAAPTSVDVVVRTPTPGSYTNQALITGVLSDPNPANNVAGATITVAPPLSAPAPVPPSCTVIALAKTPLSVAEAALRALHCGIGKVTKASSKTVAKGLVISTSPGAGATPVAGSAVNVTVSSGPPKSKKHKKKKKH